MIQTIRLVGMALIQTSKLLKIGAMLGVVVMARRKRLTR